MRDGTSRRCANTYRTTPECSYIDITRKSGEIISVKFDTDFLQTISQFHWQYTNAGYVRTTGTQGSIFMHRMICELLGYNLEQLKVDHINGDTLDNRRQNLRVCDNQGNCRNTRRRPIRINGGVIGVRKDIRCKNSWRAQIYTDKNSHKEKTFRSQTEAIIQRLKWELEYFGEFAPQIELITSEYPWLLNDIKEPD